MLQNLQIFLISIIDIQYKYCRKPSSTPLNIKENLENPLKDSITVKILF